MPSNWISREKRQAVYESDGCRCLYCGATESEGALLTLDHLVPQILGGGHEATNLVTACLSCNSARQETSVARFLRTLDRQGVETGEIKHRIALAVRRHARIEAQRPVRTRRTA